MGDFNAKHPTFNNITTNPACTALNTILKQPDLVLIIGDKPFHYSSSYNSVNNLDLCTLPIAAKVTMF
jgi:predicted solute-binding protein